jgi:3-hydroxypropanoate dehydrogenase
MKTPIADAAQDQIFRSARTAHGFRPEPIADATLHALYELLKWGPTSFNCQPARFVFLRSAEAKSRLKPTLSTANVEQTLAAPVTVILASDMRFYDHLPTQFPAYDARPMFANNAAASQATAFRNSSLQGAYLVIAARALGLDCGAMSGFDAAAVDAAFFPDGQYKANFLINLGVADTSKTKARGPRLSFAEAAEIM